MNNSQNVKAARLTPVKHSKSWQRLWRVRAAVGADPGAQKKLGSHRFAVLWKSSRDRPQSCKHSSRGPWRAIEGHSVQEPAHRSSRPCDGRDARDCGENRMRRQSPTSCTNRVPRPHDNLQEEALIKVSVMYFNKPGVRFDHDYYRTKHLPLIKSREGCGLEVLHHRQGARGWEREASGRICRHVPPAVWLGRRVLVVVWTACPRDRRRHTQLH